MIGSLKVCNIRFRLSCIYFLATLLCACSQKQGGETCIDSSVEDSTKTIVMSDDSLITVYWWDTGNGGTAPDIEAVCRFRTETGDINEESRPLLTIIHLDEDYGHHEVEKIVGIDSEYGERVYFFYLRAKVGSNEFAYDIITMMIDGDSLVPINVINVAGRDTSHISLNLAK